MTLKKKTFTTLIAALTLGSAIGSADAFQESPMLEALVAEGKLPPVSERLPKNPMVLDVVSQGTHGGTWQRAYKGPGDRWGPTKLIEERILRFKQGDEGDLELIPTFVESWSMTPDATSFTFTLLEGLTWSDGHPVTTEDVRFWYEDVFLNTDVVPKIDPLYAPGGTPMKVEIADERTFTVSFAEPYVYFLTILAKDSTGEPSLDRPTFLMPAHYLKDFLPKYAGEEALAKIAAEKGAATWKDLWGSKGLVTSWFINPDLPVITPWKVTVPPPADVMVMERNPYYYMVDPEGNQLPYIDRIEHKLFDGQENFNLMVVQGNIDMQQRHAFTGDFTFYKENEEKGDYQVLKWINSQTWALIPNLTTPNEQLAKLYGERDFREALSIAIDRETLNELTEAGLGEPRAAAPVSGSPYYQEDLEQHWTGYDPDRANALLDGLGLTERDGEGYRLLPDGSRLAIVVEAREDSHANSLELIRGNWQDVGIALLARLIDRTQFDNNRDNNTWEMQYTSFDRLSFVPADPRLMLGDDGYAAQYFEWNQTKGASGIEPPADHPLRTMWALWDKAAVAGSQEEADAAVNEMIRMFVENGFVIGLVGETPALVIVKNDFKNVLDGLINDDVTRGPGLAFPMQFYMTN